MRCGISNKLIITLRSLLTRRLMVRVLLIILSYNRSIYIFINVFSIGGLRIDLRYLLDIEASIFLLTVRLISYAVFNFRYSYIRIDKSFSYFNILLFIFVFSIITLIFSSNLIGMMLGWDGLGVTSYLLVIYYGSEKSYCAGGVTFLTNRLGDLLIMLSIGYTFSYGRFNMSFYPEVLTKDRIFIFLLFVGACTKRAQIPFRAWLPAAMAAPTPVSSLVHSSTLVTAGIYLILRNITRLYSYRLIDILFYTGALTMTIARLSALNEKDIKKIVALSTLRQLGLMAMSLGLGIYSLAYMHLIIHAFFKAIIFISTGNLIHLSQRYQSIKNTGSLLLRSPLNRRTVIISRMRLIGLPFIAAFFSKEPIIELSVYSSAGLREVALSLGGVLLTGLYSMRFVLLVIANSNNMGTHPWSRDRSFLLHKGILVLIAPSFLRGSLMARSYCLPGGFFYRSWVKYFIFLILVIPLGLIGLESVPVIKIGEFTFFSIWNLRSFTRSLFNKETFGSRLYKDSLAGPSLNTFLVTSSRVNTRRPLLAGETSYIYRVVSVVPVFLLICLLV